MPRYAIFIIDEPSDCQCPNCNHWGRKGVVCKNCGVDKYMPIHDHGFSSNEDTKPPHKSPSQPKKLSMTKREEDTDYPSIDWKECNKCGFYSTDNPCHACRQLGKPTSTPAKIKPDNWMALAKAKTIATG